MLWRRTPEVKPSSTATISSAGIVKAQNAVTTSYYIIGYYTTNQALEWKVPPGQKSR